MMRLTEEQRRLAAEAVPIAHKVAKGYAKSYPQILDELIEAADSGAMRAAVSFGPRGGRDWEAWVKRNARWAIGGMLKERRYAATFEGPGGLETAFARDDGRATKDAVAAFLARLRGHQETVIRKVYWERKSGNEIAEELGITGRRVQQIHVEALNAMRASIEIEA